jgi:4-amino-4-deoxy-L-arabinose transferase-like glycosyltransferase
MENRGGRNLSSIASISNPNYTPNQRWWQSLPLIVITAFLLRLAVITVGHTYRITPARDHFQFGWEMGRIARSIALGQGFSSPTDLPTGPSAWAPPVYPYILAGVFKLFGVYSNASAWVILAINSVFGALTCITIYHIARMVYRITVARAISWTWALFPYAIYWPVRVVWEASLSAFLLSLVLLLTLRMADQSPKLHLWIGYGVLWGFLGLTNTALISMLPFFVGWLLYRLRGRSQPVIGACLCLVMMAVTVCPWIVRNYSLFGKFIFVRDNLPLELHLANNDLSTGLWTRSEHPGNDPEAMQRFHDVGEIRFMEEKDRQFREFVRDHPGQFLAFTLQRAAYFWIGTPQNATVGKYNLLPLRHLAYLLSSGLGFMGLWMTLCNRRPGGFLLACLLLFYPLAYYLVNPFPRYKHPIEPELLLLIVYSIWCSLSSRRAESLIPNA